MIPLKYNTASQEIPLGYFLDSTDGDTAETGLTIANTDIKLWKNGATTLANKNSGGATHISGGIYYATLDATDTNTYGPLKIFVHVSGALPCILECLVMEANAYDAAYAALGTGYVETNVTQISGDSTAANNLELDYDGTGYAKANSTIGTTTTNTDLVTAAAVADAVWDEAAAGHTAAGSTGLQLDSIEADTNELQTDDIPTLIAALPTAVENRTEMDSNSTQLTAIVADTNELQTDDVPGLIAALNNISTAEVNTQVDTALSDIHLDHLLATTYDPASKPGAADALLNELVEDDAGVSRYTVNALENAPSGTGASAATIADAVWEEAIADHSGTGGSTAEALAGATAPTAAAVADAVWDEAAADHTAAGSTGLQLDSIEADTNELQTDDVPTLIAALPTAVENRQEMDSNSTQLTAIVADTNELQTDDVPGLIAALNDPTAAAVADAVWDEAAAGHTAAGSTGLQLDSIEADTNELQTDDVPTLIAALPTAVENRTEMDSNSTQLTAIVADTNELQTDDVPGLIAALNDPTAAAVADAVWDEAAADHTAAGSTGLQLDSIEADTNELQTDDVPTLIAALPTAVENRTEMDSNSTQLTAIVADTNELQTDDVPGLIAALNDLSAAAVNAEVDTAFTTIMADSVPADGTIPTREQALYMINQFLLERAVAGTTVTVKKVDGSTALMTLTLSDATTPTSITRAT